MRTHLGLCFALALTSCQNLQTTKDNWVLVWEDNFDRGETFDTATWSKIPRGNPDWARNMSAQSCCYDVENGNLVLRGMVNNDFKADSTRYITGGVYTKHKRAFHGGRLEIRAKLQSAKGAWPAIWLKPFEESRYPWPTGGEIDIMEHLNYDSIVYQTVHTVYTRKVSGKHPRNGSTMAINRADYNTYAVEMYPDSLVFFVNGKRDYAYPRIETAEAGQFPFDKPYYLLIDMQLGGSWVGKVDPATLPVEMKIDWVRYYQKPLQPRK